MKYKQWVSASIILTAACLGPTSAASEESLDGNFESFERSSVASLDFPTEMRKCIEERQYQIAKNFTHGKNIIVNCFKTTLVVKMLRYLGESPGYDLKLFNGLFELKKVNDKHNSKKNEYVRMYRKAMEKMSSERKRLNAFRNQTEEEKEKQLERINKNSEAFLSEVIRNLRDEKEEKLEEEKLKREMADPKLLSVLDALSRNYMLRLRFYPGVAARMARSENGGFTFDLEIQETEDEQEEEGGEISSDESSTREIKDGPQGKDYFDDDEGNRKKRKKSKGGKKKKKEEKKKAKKLKKIIPYLLLPMLIQMTLLPFVFKKLFFLAMKALFAGKVALILVGFNLLRNTCIKKDEDDYQKIRVEHYGYRRGEEYGAWINGRSLKTDPSVTVVLSEEPFRAYKTK